MTNATTTKVNPTTRNRPEPSPPKVGPGDPAAPIVDDHIEVRAAEIPRRYRARYRKVMSGRSRKEAVKFYCLECVDWNLKEVAACTMPECQFYKWRMPN